MHFLFSFMQLKVQEALRKKEKFQREHEEVSLNLFRSVFTSFALFWTVFFVGKFRRGKSDNNEKKKSREINSVIKFGKSTCACTSNFTSFDGRLAYFFKPIK